MEKPMTVFVRAGLVAALYTSLAPSASAQWQASAGPGVRGVIHAEYGTDGHRLVRESGWLPGMALQAGYRTGRFTWLAGVDWYRGGIGYRGQNQAGVATASTTSTWLAAAHLGAAYALGQNDSILLAVEADRWRRDIHGTSVGAGLQERYRSTRLVGGTSRVWHAAPGTLSADGALVLVAPERLRVGFSGVLDPATFQTRRGYGLRLGVGMRPTAAPYLEVRGRYDWVRTPRSGDAPLTAGMRLVGTVAQPEHVRQGLTLTVSAAF